MKLGIIRLFIIFIIVLMFIFLYNIIKYENPYQSYDICFKADCPGATDRFTTYTPVRCSDKNVVLGESIGADHGKIHFEDIDEDGFCEVIVESSVHRCRISADCYDAYRIVLKVHLKDPPEFEIISEELLEDIVPDFASQTDP